MGNTTTKYNRLQFIKKKSNQLLRHLEITYQENVERITESQKKIGENV